jgi:hypothetical protein
MCERRPCGGCQDRPSCVGRTSAGMSGTALLFGVVVSTAARRTLRRPMKSWLAASETCATSKLERRRNNLALRSWPNWTRAHTVLAAQDYLPLLEGRLMTQSRRQRPEVDRRVLRRRSTTLAILEALETLQEQAQPQPLDHAQRGVNRPGRAPRVTGRKLAVRLQLHPTTVYAHLKQLRTLRIIE